MLEAAAVAVILVIAGCALLVRLAAYAPAAPIAAAISVAAGDPGADPALMRPALVNLLLTRCAPDSAAYCATILDLAARGFLTALATAGGLWVELAHPPAAGPLAGPFAASRPAADPAMTCYERLVLDDMSARLAAGGGAPFQALADACTVDVRGTWEPFERQLRAAARDDGLCRPLLPATGRSALRAGAVGVAVAAGAFIAGHLGRHSWHGEPVALTIATLFVLGSALGWLGRRERLTAAGAALAGRCRREPPGLAAALMPADPATPSWADLTPPALRAHAFAVAAGVPHALPGIPASAGQTGQTRRTRRTRRASQPDARESPAEAWSSFTGNWRLVPIGPGERMGMGAGIAMLVGAAWLAVITYAVSIPGGILPLQVVLASAAVALACLGIRRVSVMAQLPKAATFDGQVIARWQEETDSETGSGLVSYIAVDDGERGWIFSGSAVVDRAALSDLVRVMVNPRTRSLAELTVTGRRGADPVSEPGFAQAAAAPASPVTPVAAVLLAADEAAAALGPLRRTTEVPTPAGSGVIYQGPRGTLSVVTVTGGIAQFNLRLGRRHGSPLPAIGDEAWLLNRRRSVVLRAGQHVAKLTLSRRRGAQPPVPLEALAETVAGRLAARLPAEDGGADSG